MPTEISQPLLAPQANRPPLVRSCRSSTPKDGNGDGTPGDDGNSKNRSKKSLEEGEGNCNSSSRPHDHGARMSRSRNHHGRLNNDDPSNLK